jgi:hypothetical protein
MGLSRYSRRLRIHCWCGTRSTDINELPSSEPHPMWQKRPDLTSVPPTPKRKRF